MERVFGKAMLGFIKHGSHRRSEEGLPARIHARSQSRRKKVKFQAENCTAAKVRPVRPSRRNLAKRIISDLAELKITEGRRRGESFIVLPWQNTFVHGFSENAVSILTVGRGNGKTTLVAGIAISALKGALSRPRGEIVLVASSLKQARIAFRHVLFFMPEVRRDRKKWRGDRQLASS